ncbi:MAG: hypothetical protein K9J16_17080 [Melioribacteraceae bacterium]|nr:hypothetical protein [Melioribacteraceae bacterium]MCF8353631.1 hypothetical protein [Melioribacteraceae bacterium]MCF8393401.1 hypothetical protein [Melioribacteraceae bacterium]MCF8419258.1 hypothetical protein [Melioribacteraceae bacterium]
MGNNKKLTMFLTLVVLGLSVLVFSSSIFAQSVKDLKGKATKITIETDAGEKVTLEGNEAADFIKKHNSFRWINAADGKFEEENFKVWTEGSDSMRFHIFTEDDLEEGKIMSFVSKDKFISPGDSHFVFYTKGGEEQEFEIVVKNIDAGDSTLLFISDENSGEFDKEIMVEEVEGELTVTVTEAKDGETETKTYRGEEAKKYLDEQDNVHMMKIRGEDGEDSKVIIKKMKKGMDKMTKGKKVKKIIIEKEIDDDKK